MYTQSLHTRDSYRTYAHSEVLTSYVFTIELLLRVYRTAEDGAPVSRPVGLRVWKHAISPNYSDSLLFDRQRWSVASLKAKPASRKRARDAVGPTIGSLADLLRLYQRMCRDAPPLVGSWDTLLRKPRTPPLSGDLYARDAPNELHVLAPELLLDPRNNQRALTAGIDATNKWQSEASTYGTSPLVLGPTGCPHYALDPGSDPLCAPLPKGLLRLLCRPPRPPALVQA